MKHRFNVWKVTLDGEFKEEVIKKVRGTFNSVGKEFEAYGTERGYKRKADTTMVGFFMHRGDGDELHLRPESFRSVFRDSSADGASRVGQ